MSNIQAVEGPPRKLPFITSPSTSAGAPITAYIVGYSPVGIGLWAQGTSSIVEVFLGQEQVLILQSQTNSGIREQPSQSSSSAIMELRRLTGLTWDQLARFFRVTPRSLYFWASGKALTPANEEHLCRLLATIRRLDRGSAHENRTLLLSALDQVVSLLGPRQARPKPSPLSAAARVARTPPPPEFFIATGPERVHEEVGKARVPRISRVKQ
jgi:DNA-binding transcriptional regulator YiaG